MNIEARREYQRQWKLANPERVREYARRNREKDPERRRESAYRWRRQNREKYLAQHREQGRRARALHPDRLRELELKSHYGITSAEYQRVLATQGAVCAVCRRPETLCLRGKVKHMAVDHDHTSGKVRGLLCHACNAAIGAMRDDPEVLRAAATYLERPFVGDRKSESW